MVGVFGSIMTAMVTPFDADLRVDEAATVRLMHHLLAHGTQGLVMAGTTGEASTLTDDEKIALFRLARNEAGAGVPVVANTGSNDTAHSVHLTEEAAAIGCDAVLAVTPYYNRPPRAGIVAHFAAIAAVGVPVIVYNIPGRAQINLDPDALAEIAGIPNVVGVKQAHDDLGELRRILDDGALKVWAGNDDLLLDVALLGGEGVISVASHLVGEQMGRIAALAATDPDEARRVDESLRDLYAGLFVTTNPILIKAALAMLGLIPSDRMRLPMVQATPVQRDILRTVLEHHGALVRG
jgi:4-hydroxy-tetrahydrodipicolinate synthase